MTDKEQIIIDGKKEKVNILFECNHIDDLQAYEMVKNRIEITPENAPICNFKIKIVSNTKSPYGFYTIFQKDPKKDEWEYMGIGNSGASSLITALLKTHEMGLKRISDLEKRIIKHSDVVEEYCSRLADKDHELKTLCKAFEIEYAKDEETGHMFGRSNKLLRKEQECEELKAQIETYLKMLENPEFKVALTDVRTGEREVWRSLGNKAQKYKQALDDILEFIDREDWSILEHVDKGIKDIINEAKRTANNEQ